MTRSHPMQHVARWLIARRATLFCVGLLLSIAAYRPATRLAFDRSLENFFAEDDPLLVPYREAKQVFGNESIALAAYRDPQLMTSAGMARLTSATAELAQVPGVKSVFSLNNNPLLEDRIRHQDNPVSRAFLELYEGYTVGADRQTTAVVCMLATEEEAGVSREETVAALRATIEQYPEGVVTGEPVMVSDGFRYLEEDSTVLGRTSTLLLVITIVLCFRSLRWVLIPVVVVNVTLLWTKALLVLGGVRLTMVSSMLWAIVTVIGIGAVVHIIVRFREIRDRGATAYESLLLAATMLGVPITWTCLTDAAGFGALTFARVGPVQDFGTMMSVGAVLAIGSMALLIPGMALLGRIDTDPKKAWGEWGLDFGLNQTVNSVERFPWLVGALVIVVAGTSILGCIWIEVETDFTKNFRASSPVVRSYEFVEDKLGGAGVWDIYFPLDGEIDEPFLDKVRALETKLRQITVVNEEGVKVPGLTKVLSLVDALDTRPLGDRTDDVPIATMITLMRGAMPDMTDALYGQRPGTDERFYRIMLRARERQPSRQKQVLIDRVEQLTREQFPEAHVTGFFVLLTQLINSIIRDQWVTFSIAAGAIGCMMFAAFRSLRLALVALVPNALPILVLTGLMGWLGLQINMGAAMIAAVSMGLSVDSSIHYLAEFRRMRRSGANVHASLLHAHQTVGRAMVFSTVAIIVGFSALTLSQFIPLVYFGVLVSLAMAGGTAGNLVVLPLLLKLVDRDTPQVQEVPAMHAGRPVPQQAPAR